MNKAILIIPAILLCIGTIYSQASIEPSAKVAIAKPAGAPRPAAKTVEESTKISLEKVGKLITITPEQSEKLKKVYTDFFTQIDAMRLKRPQMSEEQFTAANAEIVKKRNEAIKASLTPEQVKVIEQKHEERQKAKNAASGGKK